MRNSKYIIFVLSIIAFSFSTKAFFQKRELLSDTELLELVQKQTFKYFWDAADKKSGWAKERLGAKVDKNAVITSGGTGLGIASFPVAVERSWITRQEALQRLSLVLDFIEKAEKFHGAFAHWYDPKSKKAVAFSKYDDGGDIVETAFLIQGLLINRQYFNRNTEEEEAIRTRINTIWNNVEWSWYVQPNDDHLTWHWSKKYGFIKNHKITGYNEALVAFVLGVGSKDYAIGTDVYHKGWARSGKMKREGRTHYGLKLPLGPDYGGPLFFTHYSFLGLNPKKMKDRYADYWEQNTNHAKINYLYCVENPKGYKGYSEKSWGLTASYGYEGYSAHSPKNDRGVITPTAALSSFPYTPKESMAALRHFYFDLGDKIWGAYGFTDAFSEENNWHDYRYLAIDQAPIIGMIENYRTGLLWDLFMSCPEIQEGLIKMGFQKSKL